MNNKPLEMIVAATARGEIGYQNTLPWRLKGDLRRFKALTMGNILVMGKNTYESLPGPLDGRTVVVVSKSFVNDYSRPTSLNRPKDTYFVLDLVSALQLAKDLPGDKVFIAGGVQLYQAAMQMPITLHLTLVHKESANGYDAVIPNFNLSNFDLIHTDFPPSVERVAFDQNQTVYDTDAVTNIPTPSHTYLTYKSKNHPDNG